jgi:hypothetical protein
MSDIATSNANPSTETAPAQDTPAPAPPAARVDRLVHKAMAFVQRNASEPAASAVEGDGQAKVATPDAAPADAATEPATATATGDVKKPDPADIRQLSKAQQSAIKQQREAYEAKQAAKRESEARAAAEARAKDFEAKLGGRDLTKLLEVAEAFEAKDPKKAYKLLKQSGLTMEDLAKAVIDEPDAEPEDPKEAEIKLMRAEIERIKAEKAAELEAAKAEKERLEAERAAEQKSAEDARYFQQNVEYVSGLLKEKASEYTAIASFPRAPSEIVRRWSAHIEEHGEAPDLDALMSKFNADVDSDVDQILAGEHALKAFLTRHKERALSILGVKSSATSPASTQGDNGQRNHAPAAIPKSATATAGARKDRPRTQDEKIAAAMAQIIRPKTG